MAAAGNALVRPLHRPAEYATKLSALNNLRNWASLGNILIMQTLISIFKLDTWFFHEDTHHIRFANMFRSAICHELC